MKRTSFAIEVKEEQKTEGDGSELACIIVAVLWERICRCWKEMRRSGSLTERQKGITPWS
jgi:hypothetical protein